MRKAFRIILVLFIIAVFCWFFIQTTKDEMIPEPTLKVVVNGIETRDYWADLLVQDNGIYQTFKSEEVMEAVDKLAKYEDEDGFHPAMLKESSGPIYGRLRGVWIDEATFKHEFWGDGIPREFKVAMLTGEGNLIVSDVVKTYSYHSTVHFDIDSSSITNDVVTDFGDIYETIPWVGILIIFIVRIIIGLLIKVLVGNAVGFKSDKSTKIMLKTNVITQSILNILLLTQVFYGVKYALNILVVASIVITIVDMIVYGKYLDEHKKIARFKNALIANVASTAALYFLIYFIQWVSF